MLEINQEKLKAYNAEQIAGIVLVILQKIDNREMNPSYYGGSLESILAYEITPKWLGRNVENGFVVGNGYIKTYAPERPPVELKELFDDAVTLLRNEDLIKQDTQQSSANFVILTERGKSMKIKSDFHLHIIRRRQEIIKKYSDSVLLIETLLNGDISCGTCFLIPNETLVTCRHNIEGRNFSIIFDSNTRLDDTNFDVSYHQNENIDIAIIRFKSEMFKTLVKNTTPLELGLSTELDLGDDLCAIGFPKVAQRQSQKLVSEGTFQNFTEDYIGNKYVTITNQIHGGYSGGPLISMYGQVIAVITESTEQVTGTDGQATVRGTHFHATPIEEINNLV